MIEVAEPVYHLATGVAKNVTSASEVTTIPCYTNLFVIIIIIIIISSSSFESNMPAYGNGILHLAHIFPNCPQKLNIIRKE